MSVITGCLPSGETDFVNNLGKNDITFENDYENVTPSGTNAYEGKVDVSKMGEINNRKYLEVDGKPFLMLGAQLRTDFFIQLDNKQLDELDKYFEYARSLNVTVVQVPISWRDIEPKKNSYTDAYVKAFIDYCVKYKMKLEILWFGAWMCGYSVEGYLPSYVTEFEEQYPSYKPEAAFNGWLGKHYYLIPNTPELLERETKALKFMMDSIYEYDSMNGGRKTVIGIQIENEPDMLATRHNNEHGFTPEQIWPDLITHLDVLGQVVKNHDYNCYTRVNITSTYSDYMERAAQIVATEGIDFVGVDPYLNQVNQIKGIINQLDAIEGNFPHIAENGGEYANNDILQLLAFTLGGGYEVFEVITTPHPFLVDWTLRGVYNPDFSKKDHTDLLIDANLIYRRGYVDLATAPLRNIIGYNLNTNSGLVEAVEEKDTDSATIRWETSERGVAYAIENNGYLTVASTKKDKMTFKDVELEERAEVGYYDVNAKWIKLGSVAIKDNVLNLEECLVYRIKIK